MLKRYAGSKMWYEYCLCNSVRSWSISFVLDLFLTSMKPRNRCNTPRTHRTMRWKDIQVRSFGQGTIYITWWVSGNEWGLEALHGQWRCSLNRGHHSSYIFCTLSVVSCFHSYLIYFTFSQSLSYCTSGQGYNHNQQYYYCPRHLHSAGSVSGRISNIRGNY